jgi:F0F1-type ATP synthase epsilon subunit
MKMSKNKTYNRLQEEKLFDPEVDEVTLPSANGLITLLKDHNLDL